jgi:hypothetical protein
MLLLLRKKIWNWIIWTKSIRKYNNKNNNNCMYESRAYTTTVNGFYTKIIIAFVMCNVTNLSTKKWKKNVNPSCKRVFYFVCLFPHNLCVWVSEYECMCRIEFWLSKIEHYFNAFSLVTSCKEFFFREMKYYTTAEKKK